MLARVAAAFYMGDAVNELPGTSDQLSYHHLALRVLDGHGFSFAENWWPVTRANEPTAHWSFLYTLFLTGVYAIFGPHPLAARLLQAIIVGLLQPWLTYKLGGLLFNQKVGLWAAFLNSIYIYFIYYAGTLMTEPFYITAILGSLLLAVSLVQINETNRNRWVLTIALGFTLGITVLLRQLFLLFVPFLLLWVWWKDFRQHAAIKWYSYVLPLLVVGIMILPFSIYNTGRFGHFVLLNTNSGYAFYWGNHPYYGDQFQPILTDQNYLALLPEDQLHLDEAALDQELLRQGVGFVLDDPIRYLKLSMSRIPAYFEFLPKAESSLISNISRTMSFGILWPFMLAGIVLAWTRQKSRFVDTLASPFFLMILFCLIYTSIHVLTWTLPRYRLPVDAVLLLFAGFTFDVIATYFSKRRQCAK